MIRLLTLALLFGQIGGSASVGGSASLAGGSSAPSGVLPSVNTGNQANSHTGGGTTVSATLGTVTPGDQILAFATCTGTASTTLSIADVNTGGSNQTWATTPLNSTYSGSTTTGVVSVWKVASANAIPSGDAITVSSTSTCTNFNVFSVEGASIGAVDVGPSGASGLTSGSVTPNFTYELVIGLVSGGDGGANNVAGAGYTLISSNDIGSANPGWEYRAISACAAQQAVFASGSGTQYTNILTFQSSSPGAHC